MVMEAAPNTAFVVAEAKLLFEFQIIALDPPAQLGEPDEIVGLGIGGKIGDPEFAGFSLVFGPIDKEPKLWPRLVKCVIAMGLAKAALGGEARDEIALDAGAPCDLPRG